MAKKAADHHPPGKAPVVQELSADERLRLFDEATARQRAREQQLTSSGERPAARDWTREELYTRKPSNVLV